MRNKRRSRKRPKRKKIFKYKLSHRPYFQQETTRYRPFSRKSKLLFMSKLFGRVRRKIKKTLRFRRLRKYVTRSLSRLRRSRKSLQFKKSFYLKTPYKVLKSKSLLKSPLILNKRLNFSRNKFKNKETYVTTCSSDKPRLHKPARSLYRRVLYFTRRPNSRSREQVRRRIVYRLKRLNLHQKPFYPLLGKLHLSLKYKALAKKRYRLSPRK